MKVNFQRQGYEAPRAEAYKMTQEAGILSSSVPTPVPTFQGDGFHFGSQNGKW